MTGASHRDELAETLEGDLVIGGPIDRSQPIERKPAPAGGTFVLVTLRDGKSHPLKMGINSIGRDLANDLVLVESGISRRHCVVRIEPSGKCEVRDAHSRNGTLVNHATVTRADLVPGDVLSVWDQQFMLAWLGPDGEQLPAATVHVLQAVVPARVAKADVEHHVNVTEGQSFYDEVLGHVTWNGDDSCWHFSVGRIDGRLIRASYAIQDRSAAYDQNWEKVRALVHWLRFNESAIRERLVEEGWRKPVLGRVLIFCDQQARLQYDCSTRTVWVQMCPDGAVAVTFRFQSEKKED